MDEPNTDTPESREQEREVDALTTVFKQVVDKRHNATIKAIENKLLGLAAEPDETDIERIYGPKPQTPDEHPSVTSRWQPTDSLYRRLHARHPEQSDWRTPMLDHWNSQWLRAFVSNDTLGMKVANAKSCEAAGIRANTLAGTLDVTTNTALTLGSGAHLLPQPFANVVEIARDAAAVIAPLCTNFTTDGITLRVPTVGAITAVTAAEGAAPAQAEPTFASEMLILHKLGARCIASDEMLADSSFNVMDIYAMRAGTGIGVLEDTQICTTDGVTPNLTEAIAGAEVDGATTTVLIYEDLNTLFFSLGKAYQTSSSWVAGTLVCTLLSNMLDTNGAPILRVPGNAPGPVTDVGSPLAIGTVLGRPVYHVPLTAGTVIFGDLRGYGFVRKGGIEAKMDTSVGFASDTVQFKFTERCDGRIIDDVALKQTVNIATVA